MGLRPITGLVGMTLAVGLLAACGTTPTATPTTAAPPPPPSTAPSTVEPAPQASPSAASSPPLPPPLEIPSEQAASEALSTEAPVLITATPSASASPSPSDGRPGTTVVIPPPDNEPAFPMPRNPIGMSPLTGLPIGAHDPVLVLKLDNTRYAQPHAGLTHADVVYLEEVEYGITRIAAVFSSNIPKRIGPIRSARITDIDLLAQYGKPAFGYSGAQRKMLPLLGNASIYDVSPYHLASVWSRDNSRRAPYNLYVNGVTAAAHAPRASLAKDMGFVFAKAVPVGGYKATKATMAWGYGTAAFDYDRSAAAYAVSLNGQRARAEESTKGQMASTVVIQYVKQTKSQFWDKGGGNTPHAQTIGSGDAIVLRDGVAYKVRWHRPNARSGTTFTLPDGTLLAFKPGQLWIVLLDRKRKATVTPMTKRPIPPSPTPTPAPSVTTAPAPTADTTPAPVATDPTATPSASQGGQ